MGRGGGCEVEGEEGKKGEEALRWRKKEDEGEEAGLAIDGDVDGEIACLRDKLGTESEGGE
jgi:hypothetical protein